jgi:hypothetical protein
MGGSVVEARSVEEVLSFIPAEADSGRVAPNDVVSESSTPCGRVNKWGMRLLGKELCRDPLRCPSMMANRPSSKKKMGDGRSGMYYF